MAKGKHLSRYQQGIVRRYYEHLDTIAIQKISETASELFLCTDPKKAAKLWAQAERALEKTAASDAAVRQILSSRDVKGLAALANELSG